MCLISLLMKVEIEDQKHQFFSPVAGVIRLRWSVWIFPPMLKRRSLSTDDDGEPFQDRKNMLRLVSHYLRVATSRGSSGRQQNLSRSLFRVSGDGLSEPYYMNVPQHRRSDADFST